LTPQKTGFVTLTLLCQTTCAREPTTWGGGPLLRLFYLLTLLPALVVHDDGAAKR